MFSLSKLSLFKYPYSKWKLLTLSLFAKKLYETRFSFEPITYIIDIKYIRLGPLFIRMLWINFIMFEGINLKTLK